MSSTLNGDFLQFITPYYIRSSCESEVPVPMTRVSVLICRHIRIIINLSAKLVKRKQTTKCYDSFFIPIIKIISFYAVKMHKMKTNEAIHLVTECPVHLITECPIHLVTECPVHLITECPIHLITECPIHLVTEYPVLMTLGCPVLMTLGYPVLMT